MKGIVLCEGWTGRRYGHWRRDCLGRPLDPDSFDSIGNDPRVFAVTSLRAEVSSEVAAHGFVPQSVVVQPSLLYSAIRTTDIAP